MHRDWSQVLFTDESRFSSECKPDVFWNIKYAEEILKSAVATGNFFLYKKNNARLHTVRLVKNFLEAETIQGMGWIACSPDLNLIELVWDTLGRRFAARPKPPVTWRTGESDFVKSGIVFLKFSSVTSSHSRQTGV
ncbi:hypothetical protein TNCV_1679941 [Trichonephila clavipes]|nr:hypothetical protein TNCV_1679941 [Trichonephila clavipes]